MKIWKDIEERSIQYHEYSTQEMFNLFCTGFVLDFLWELSFPLKHIYRWHSYASQAKRNKQRKEIHRNVPKILLFTQGMT